MPILSKVHKSDNSESLNSLKCRFTNIRALFSNFVVCEFFLELNSPVSLFVGCESFFESNSPVSLALCGTNQKDSTDSNNYSAWGYLPLIQNDSVTHMNDLVVYLKEEILFACDLSPENSEDCFFLRFQLALLQSAPYLFSTLNHCAIFVCIVFGVISTNINRLLSINSSAKVFFFGDISVYHKDQLSYSGGTYRPDEYCHNLKRPYSDSGLSYANP